MMYIIRQCDKAKVAGKLNDEPEQYNWHVGEARPRERGGSGFEDVCEIYADGHELANIRKNYANLPDVPSAHSMTWKGQFAQFIYDHIPSFGNKARVNETAHYR
jgi:hypothetical protein